MSNKSVSLLPVYAVGFLNSASITLLYPVMPPFAAGLGGSVAQVGLVVALQPYVAAFTLGPVGLLSDRLGRRTLLLVGIIVFILCYFAYLFTSDLGMLMAVRAISGLGHAAFYPAASALVVDIAPQEERGKALGLFTTGTQLGSMVGPALGGFLLQNYSYQAAFLASAVISILCLLLALSRFKYVSGGSTIYAGDKLSIKWLGERDCMISLVATLLVMVGIVSVISFLPLYGRYIDVGAAQVGIIIAMIYMGSVLTRALSGKLSDTLGRMPVILTGLSLCALGVFLFSFLTRPIALLAAAFVMGLGLGVSMPACSALIADIAPQRMRGFAMGLNSASFNAGQALGATGLGILAEARGFPTMYLATALILAASILVTFMITRKARPVSPTHPGRPEVS